MVQDEDEEAEVQGGMQMQEDVSDSVADEQWIEVAHAVSTSASAFNAPDLTNVVVLAAGFSRL